MAELLVVLVGNLLTMIDMSELFGGRRRRSRAAASARGERVEYPCVLRSEEVTDGRERRGWIAVGEGTATWRTPGAEPVPFELGELTMQAVDRQAVTFQSPGGRTELRLHPDEAPPVLRALGG
ncbi:MULTISPECIES: hypothetical protein [unclassified Amycolatopsis]|uniref:hypothetical protein n=1 Tax=unclassified Amycolatopsis TaxID=2618356 RepID=UPI002875B1E7|nr:MULTISPECIES: hypothetical protein [unclassified Amycolatopsis]MDS0132530.1 hypothetical protein [Amycolatopsis sp. 505]MDS0142646.1 hypothetical protein [Amycolatopsis sp. CM201R]